MTYRRLHPWNVTVQRAARIQEELRAKLRRLRPLKLSRPRYVAGADVSYDRGSDRIHGAVVVLSLPDLELVECAGSTDSARFPYVPGYLSFREIPVLLKAFSRIRKAPDLILCDGQGIAHPRGFGLACHLGMVLAIPSIGCAKSRLVGEHAEPGPLRGTAEPLVHEGRTVGAVVRSRDRVAPLFVSPGYRVDLETSVRLVLSCCRGLRLPEPTRRAHVEVNRLRREAAAVPAVDPGRIGTRHPSRTSRRSPPPAPAPPRGTRWTSARPVSRH